MMMVVVMMAKYGVVREMLVFMLYLGGSTRQQVHVEVIVVGSGWTSSTTARIGT